MSLYQRLGNNVAPQNKSRSSVGLLRKTTLVATMTLFSRVLGFIRDIVLAMQFGAGGALDAFVIAFKIPNFFRRLFGEGAFSQAFVPILSELRAKESHEAVLVFVSRVFGCLAAVLLALVAVAEVLAPLIISVFAPGFLRDPHRYMLATQMLRITFPYILLISLTAMSGGVLNTHQRFAVPAFSPVLLNVALISVAWWWAPHATVPIVVIAWGVLIGGVLQLAIQIPVLLKINLLPRCKLGFSNPEVKRVLKLMLPALFGVSVAQLSLLIDNWFASFLPAGSISWLYYSDRLTYLPLGVIGVAIATVVLPNLSRQHHESVERYSDTLDWALRNVLFIGVPAAVGLMMLAHFILVVLFQHGAFDAYDVAMTTRSLVAFAFGLPAFMLIKILASAFYSRQNIRTPVRVAAWALLINLIGNIILIRWLAHAGLALSTSLAAYFNAIALLILLCRGKIYRPRTEWWRYGLRQLISIAVMVLVLWGVQHYSHHWQQGALVYKVLLLLLSILVAMIAYIGTSYGLGWRWQELK